MDRQVLKDTRHNEAVQHAERLIPIRLYALLCDPVTNVKDPTTPNRAKYNHISPMNTSDLDDLEARLTEFTADWQAALKKRTQVWRVQLLIGSILAIVIPVVFPSAHWVWLVVLGLSAGSLFSLFKINLEMQKKVNVCREHIRNARIYDRCWPPEG